MGREGGNHASCPRHLLVEVGVTRTRRDLIEQFENFIESVALKTVATLLVIYRQKCIDLDARKVFEAEREPRF